MTENFRPGTLERWGLGYDALQAENPGVILVRISAFGQTGPSREKPGFGRIAAAAGGISYLSGYPDRPPVSPGTPTIPDYLAGIMGALGALLALEARRKTGEGQVVDLALYEPIVRVLDDAIPVFGLLGHVRERIGSRAESAAPHNHFRTRDDRWIAVACTNVPRSASKTSLLSRPRSSPGTTITGSKSSIAPGPPAAMLRARSQSR